MNQVERTQQDKLKDEALALHLKLRETAQKAHAFYDLKHGSLESYQRHTHAAQRAHERYKRRVNVPPIPISKGVYCWECASAGKHGQYKYIYSEDGFTFWHCTNGHHDDLSED